MAQFRKKPVVVEAVKWNGATVGLTNGGVPFGTERLELPAWLPPVGRQVGGDKYPGHPGVGEIWRDDDNLWIGTLEGNMVASPGDWIIRGVKGELYPCKPDIFAATYDAVPEAPEEMGRARAEAINRSIENDMQRLVSVKSVLRENGLL